MSTNSETPSKTDDNLAMDYAEHEKTYSLFLSGSKILTVLCVALLVAMAFGFFAGGGFIGGTVVFFALVILSWFLL